jgi:DNA-binding GntR family transcriptional regulator
LIFRLLPRGFTNQQLREHVAALRGLTHLSAGQMSYDLRRLRSHGLIERLPRTHRYRVTDFGLHTAMLLTRVQDRVLPTGLAQLAATNMPTKLARAAAAYHTAIDELTRTEGLAA